jgi:hypothetical protein
MSKNKKKSVRAAQSAAPTDVVAASNAANNLVPPRPPDDVEDAPAHRDNIVAPTEPALVQTSTSTGVKPRIDPCQSKRISGDQMGHCSYDKEEHDKMSHSKLVPVQVKGDDICRSS